MSGVFEKTEARSLSERRVYPRQPSRSLAYVELDEGNGGIVLDVSEGGLSVQAVMSLMDDVLPRVRFKLTQSRDWIETSARVVWKSESKKVAGLQFLDLADQAHIQIRDWLSGDVLPTEAATETESRSVDVAHSPAAAVQRAESRELPVIEEAEPAVPISAPGSPASIPVQKTQVSSQGVPPESDLGFAAVIRKKALEDSFVSPHRASKGIFGHLDGATIAAKQVKIEREYRESPRQSDFPATWILVILFGFLASISLGAGWFAGRGTFDQSYSSGRAFKSQQEARQSISGASVATRGSEIEIVDVNNQRWTIPFSGNGQSPANAGAETPGKNMRERQQGISPAEAQPQRRAAAFDPGALPAPIRPPAPSNTEQERISPPVVTAPPAGSSSSLQASASASDLSDPRATTRLAPPIAFPSATPSPEQTQPGVVKHGKVINRVDAIYPDVALKQKIEGIVKLRLTVDAEGSVRNVRLITGPATLANSAETAVRQWRYTPAMLDGRAVETQEDVTFTFRLP